MYIGIPFQGLPNNIDFMLYLRMLGCQILHFPNFFGTGEAMYIQFYGTG